MKRKKKFFEIYDYDDYCLVLLHMSSVMFLCIQLTLVDLRMFGLIHARCDSSRQIGVRQMR